MCSLPTQEAYFRKTIFAVIACKTNFPCPKWLQNDLFGGSISVLCCSKNNSFYRLSGKLPSWEALFSITWIVACFLDQIFTVFSSFFKNVLPAHTGSMILKIAPPYFASKIPHFGPMMPLISSGWNHLFDHFRSCVRSVRFLSPKVTLKKHCKSVYLNYRRPLCGFRLCHSLKFSLVFIGFAVGFPIIVVFFRFLMFLA